jgi:hypothetical protein
MQTTFLHASLCFALTVTASNAWADANDSARLKQGVIVTAGDGTAVTPETTQVTPDTTQVTPDGVSIHAGKGYWQPGGYGGRIGSPYYYSAGRVVAGYRPVTVGAPGLSACGACCSGARTPRAWSPGYHGPYLTHFGPGYYRHVEFGFYRFPYYSYRRPWYFPGHPVYTRNTNFVW